MAHLRVACVLLMAVAVLPAGGQSGLGGQNGQGTIAREPLTDPFSGRNLQGESPLQDEKLLETLNADRQKSMIKDTDKLLRLVTELDADIARTRPESLTPEQLRRMAEIEKLARSVKEKMSTSVRGTPPFLPPPIHARMTLN